MRHRLAAGALALIACTPAAAQFIDNGGSTAAADTSDFGQEAAFENVTTAFDGISVKLLRLIRDPGEAEYRAVGTIEKTGSGEARALFLAPAKLEDELGNVLTVQAVTGLEPCLNGSRWREQARRCGSHQVEAARLVEGIPLTWSVTFVPEAGSYSADLAQLANTVLMTLSFAYTLDDFGSMKSNRVLIPKVPLPKS